MSQGLKVAQDSIGMRLQKLPILHKTLKNSKTITYLIQNQIS